ncbi:hypothetical protein BDP27DRAFT_1312490 [Rhodocollybia butyracea]|uniref:Uncharacterized protein n=1 Tax=Rhodocollybia butyracea TaxID=206335 RepID=A0A9P5UEZ5_9AGAR|nr:hypothetical protein BDP27DRAFT_1312490 [Rhodocollybia butyracea]
MIFSKFLFRAFTFLGVVGKINAQTEEAQLKEPSIPPLSIQPGRWIWTGGGYPGQRAFRKQLPAGTAQATCVTFAITADAAYTVWVNGANIGSNTLHSGVPSGVALDVYSVSITHPISIIAVNVTNLANIAQLFITGVVQYADGTQTAFVTDTTCKWFAAVVNGDSTIPPYTPLSLAPFTGTACGQSDKPDDPDGPIIIPPSPTVCPVLPPLPIGSSSPYWDLRYQIDCEVRRLEEALFLCQREKKSVIDQLIIIIQQISGGNGTDICRLIHCDTQAFHDSGIEPPQAIL